MVGALDPRHDRYNPGDHLLTADGHTVEAGNLLWNTAHQAPAYDLTIDQTHSYHVTAGDEEVLVHNTDCGEARDVLDDFENDEAIMGRIGDGRARSGASTDITVNGTELPTEYRSVSGENFLEGVVNSPTEPVFAPTANGGVGTPAAFDSEYKIFEEIALDIDTAIGGDGPRVLFDGDAQVVIPEAQGEIFIATRSIPGEICNSCQMVLDQFRIRYPGVTVTIEDLDLVVN